MDAVLLPVNPIEDLLGGFLTRTLPAARKKGIATIGMKVLGASHYILPKFDVSPELLVRYALSFEMTLPIVGCSSPDEVQNLARAGSSSKAMTSEEQKHILEVFEPYARKLAFYRGVI